MLFGYVNLYLSIEEKENTDANYINPLCVVKHLSLHKASFLLIRLYTCIYCIYIA